MIRKVFTELADKFESTVLKVYNNTRLKIRHNKTGHIISIQYSQLKNLSRLGKSPFKLLAKELAAIERTEELLPDELPVEAQEVIYVDVSEPKKNETVAAVPKRKTK